MATSPRLSDCASTPRASTPTPLTRIVSIPACSVTGYPILAGLTAHVEASLAEQAADQSTTSHALLHPAKRGGMLWRTSFTAKYLHPSMAAAGWPTTAWNDGAKDCTVHHLTWHSLRHRLARTAVDIDRLDEDELVQAGGWEDIATVQNRYYRSGMESRHSGTMKMARRGLPGCAPGPESHVLLTFHTAFRRAFKRDDSLTSCK